MISYSIAGIAFGKLSNLKDFLTKLWWAIVVLEKYKVIGLSQVLFTHFGCREGIHIQISVGRIRYCHFCSWLEEG